VHRCFHSQTASMRARPADYYSMAVVRLQCYHLLSYRRTHPTRQTSLSLILCSSTRSTQVAVIGYSKPCRLFCRHVSPVFIRVLAAWYGALTFYGPTVSFWPTIPDRQTNHATTIETKEHRAAAPRARRTTATIQEERFQDGGGTSHPWKRLRHPAIRLIQSSVVRDPREVSFGIQF
jgi:hypothetical protein